MTLSNEVIVVAVLLTAGTLAMALPASAEPTNPGVVSAARLETIWGDIEDEVRLRRHDKEALKMLDQYGLNKEIDKPRRGRNGAIVFPFGAGAVRIICAPLRVCDLALQPGETVMGIHIGDRGRWGILPAEVGSGRAAATHVVIKPHAINLQTNLVIHTSRRVYQLELISRKREHMPLVSFSYPDDAVQAWEAYLDDRRQEEGEVVAAISDQTRLDSLNFDYALKAAGRKRRKKPAWSPRRVYDDGKKTFIEMPRNLDAREAPILILRERGEDQIVNYRVKGRYYIVDRLFNAAALISGVGRKQQRVEIRKKEGRP